MTLPEPPDARACTIQDLAHYYAQNVDEIKAADSWLYQAKRRLGEAVRDQGPIITAFGRVSLESTSSFEYPPEIAQEFPGIGRHLVTATVATIEQAEQVLELVLELVPSADLAHDIKVDAAEARRVITNGGEAAQAPARPARCQEEAGGGPVMPLRLSLGPKPSANVDVCQGCRMPFAYSTCEGCRWGSWDAETDKWRDLERQQA